MLENISRSLTDCYANKESPLVVGVSGGPDSIVLLHTLNQLGFQLIVAHLDHKLREESGADSKYVEEIATELKIPFICSEVDTITISKEEKKSLEETARNLRYQFLFKIANQENAHAVAVGHTADDQAETVLMHMLRGSGLSGIKGMSVRSLTGWDNKIPLVRPLLNVYRSEVEAFCQDNNIFPKIDKTNFESKYHRNKIRNELFPILEEYNPNIKNKLVSLSKIATEDYKVILEIVDKEWVELVDISEEECIKIPMDRFNSKKLSIKRMLIRKSFEYLKSDSNNIQFTDIERSIKHIANPSKGQIQQITSDIFIQIHENIIYIFRDGYQIQFTDFPRIEDATDLFEGSGSIKINANWNLEFEERTFSELSFEEIKNNKDPYTAHLDKELLDEGLLLRPPQEGDYFQPLGMGGKGMKLFDFFINEKIYRGDRKHWPLLCTMNNDIIWVVGQRISHQYRLTGKTKKVLLVKNLK